MPNFLVTYLSKTGNTKKVAEAIYSALKEDKKIKPLHAVTEEEIQDADLIFIGFPVYSHTVPYKAEVFIKKISAGKKVALFSTHGSISGTRLSREALEYAVTLAGNLKVLGTFSCRGQVSMEALDILLKSPEHTAWAEMAPSAKTHPDKSELEDASAFTRWILTLFHQK
jgi:flavodoxin